LPLDIPPELRQYVVLSESGDYIDRFKCPVPGCDYSTRLGPGALRMHMILKSDPSMPSRFDPQHEEYMKKDMLLGPEQVKTLVDYPRREIAT
jgi:hypothetical protein